MLYVERSYDLGRMNFNWWWWYVFMMAVKSSHSVCVDQNVLCMSLIITIAESNVSNVKFF